MHNYHIIEAQTNQHKGGFHMKNRKRFLSLALMSAVLSTSVLTGFASDGDSGEIPTLTWYLPGNPTNMTI